MQAAWMWWLGHVTSLVHAFLSVKRRVPVMSSSITLEALSDDGLASVLCACSARTLCALCATSADLHKAATAAAVWTVLLERDYDLRLAAPDAGRALEVYRSFVERRASDLPANGYLTDGGIDETTMEWPDDEDDEGAVLSPASMALQLAAQLHILPPSSTSRGEPSGLPKPSLTQLRHGSSFWVRNAFVPSDWEFYCSDERMRNVTLAAAMQPPRRADEASARAAEMERRTYLIERLSFVARHIWAASAALGFGLSSCNTDTLEQALASAWGLPQGVAFLLHDIPPSQRAEHEQRLRNLVREIESADKRSLPVLALPCWRRAGRREPNHADHTRRSEGQPHPAWRAHMIRAHPS